MTDDNFVMRVVWAVQESLDWTIHTLRQMKTPQAAFEETHLALDACADRALQRLYSAQNVADAKKFRADVLRHGAELDRLCQDHKANLDAKNKVYERHRRLEIEKLYRRLIQAVGVDFIQNILRELAQTPSLADAVDRTAAPANQPTPPAEAEPEVVSPVEPPVRSPPANSERPAHSEASPSPARKRRTEAEPESLRPRKRNVPTSKRVQAVSFEQVYQKGHAETKHIIVEFPKGAGQWYIIRCLDCPRDFGESPMKIAGAHISSRVHGLQPRNAQTVIENFGIAVLDCDEALAAKNNAVAQQAFRKQGKGPRPPVRKAANDGMHGRRGASIIVDPTPGEIYLVYWDKAKKNWPVLLLPTSNLGDVGVPQTLEELELMDDVPPCYRWDATKTSLEWNEGFESGGEKVAQRLFPVMWFDDRFKFPFDSQVSWMPARNLEVFDIESAAKSGIPHLRSVREYWEARSQIPSRQHQASVMDVDDDPTAQVHHETRRTREVDDSNQPEATTVQPRGEGVKAGPVPVVNDGELETSTKADGNSDHNLRRKSFDIISISSTEVSGRSEIYPNMSTIPPPSEPNRTTSAPSAYVETTSPTNMGANNTALPNPVNTGFEPIVEQPHLVTPLSAGPSQGPELRNEYLTTIAQNGLKQNPGLSNTVLPWITQEMTPREDTNPKLSPSFSNFSRTPSLSNPAAHTTTIPLRAETGPPPRFMHQNQPHQPHGPMTPQAENRSTNNPAIPSVQSQPQPQPNNRFVPIQPHPRKETVHEQPPARTPLPGGKGQHVPPSRQGDQGTAARADHHGVPEHNTGRAGAGGHEASRSPATYQGFSESLSSGGNWRAVNGSH